MSYSVITNNVYFKSSGASNGFSNLSVLDSLSRNSMGETLRLVSGLQHHPGSSGGVYETTQHFNDIKEHLHVVKRDIEHLVQRNMVSIAIFVLLFGGGEVSPKVNMMAETAKPCPLLH